MKYTRLLAAMIGGLALTVSASAQAPASSDKDAEIAQLKARLAALEAPAPQDAGIAGAQAPDASPLLPLDKSPLVVKGPDGAPAVADKAGKGIDGIKLSQYDNQIGSPSMAVAPDGTIHVAFVEKHRTTYANAVYHRSSSDGGKTWTEAKNLSEDMPGIDVGRCQVIADAQNRVYVIWRAGLALNWMVPIDPAGYSSNLWFRELEGGKWSKAQAVSEPCVGNAEFNNAARSFFAALDAAGRTQVIWNVQPDKWHPELMRYAMHSPGIGTGLVFQSALEGATAGAPREVFMAPIIPSSQSGGTPSCDGLDTINGYVDSAGAAHMVGAVSRPQDGYAAHLTHYTLIEDGKEGQDIDLPNASFHEARDIPTLLVDAKGRRHLVALYLAGDHPNIRDYELGSDDEPAVIRSAVGLNGRIIGFQACQGPGGRMVAIMQMNDTGENGGGDNFVSISTGGGKWSAPVNITNNLGRKSYMARDTSSESQVAVQTGCDPGPGAAAFDREGHLLLLTVKNEYLIVHSVAFGVVMGGGESTTPTLRFLRF